MIVVRVAGRGTTKWELPGARFRRRPLDVVKGGRRTMYELAAAIAATGREVELRGTIAKSAFEEVCAAAGARPILDFSPRLPTPDDTIVFAEGWPDPLYAPYVFSGARCIMMLLAPPGFAGWPYTEDAWEKPDPLTVDPDALGRPEHFHGIAGLGCELWTHSRGLQTAAREAGIECAYIGSGQPEPFPPVVAKEHDLVVLEHNRWAPLAIEVAERVDGGLLRIPTADHAAVLRGLGSARVLVWPSRVEGHSRVQVEARAMGTVPVALSTNRFAEGLGEAGGAVVVGSPDEMAPAISELLARPAELQRLSALASESARAQVDWEGYVERIDAVLSQPQSPRPGAGARDRITRALANHEHRLRSRIAVLEQAAEGDTAPPERKPGRGGLRGLLGRRPRRDAHRAGGPEAPPPVERTTRAGPTVYVVGGYVPRGGGYMTYHVGRVVAERLGRRCRVVTVKGEAHDHGRWPYPEVYPVITRRQMEAEIANEDLLITNPSFSRNQFGLRLPGRKLMYVQGFGSLPEIDGFCDAYVCASSFLSELLQRVYGIESPVIPPFVHLDRVPEGLPWRDRDPRSVLVFAKSYGEGMLARLEAIVRREYPRLAYSLRLIQPMSHTELLELMTRHRYFLSLSPREGFGLTPLEAMAGGCAVMGFHGGGGTHFMRPGHNCEAVSYPDLEGLAAGLARVLADDEHGARIAARGRETAREYDLARFEGLWAGFLDGFLESEAELPSLT